MTALEPGSWVIDPANSSVVFSVRHMMVSRIAGRLDITNGRVVVGAEPGQASLDVSIDASSIDTNSPERDVHVRGPQFLDSEAFAEIAYHADGVSEDEDGLYTVSGELNIKGVARPVELSVQYGGAVDDPIGHRRVGFHATARFNRSDFGVTESMGPMPLSGVVVGDTVRVVIDIEAIKEAPTDSPEESTKEEVHV